MQIVDKQIKTSLTCKMFHFFFKKEGKKFQKSLVLSKFVQVDLNLFANVERLIDANKKKKKNQL